MKTIVCGSRSIVDPIVVTDILNTLDFHVTELVHGGAAGVDLLAAAWARTKGIPISPPFLPPYKRYPPKVAPHIRNQWMAEYVSQFCIQGGACIAIHDGVSRGTVSMIDKAKAAKIKNISIFVWPYKETHGK